VRIVEILFFIGLAMLCIHCLVALAAIGRLYLPPSWLWVELKMLIYPFAPVLGLRVLSTMSLYHLRSSQKEYYFYVLAATSLAMLMVMNFTAIYANLALPVLCVAFFIQWMLDAQLSPSAHKRLYIRSTSGTKRRKNTTQDEKKPMVLASQQSASELFERTKQNISSVSGHLSQRGMGESFQLSASSMQQHSPCVAIWYSQDDKKYVEELRKHLRSKARRGVFLLLDANQILPGALWQKERMQAIQAATVVVLLISAGFTACDLIAGDELPLLLHNAEKQGTPILLLHVSQCDLASTGLEKFAPLNDPRKKSLAMLKPAERAEILTQTSQIICQYLGVRR
jgi:hypothetical protein